MIVEYDPYHSEVVPDSLTEEFFLRHIKIGTPELNVGGFHMFDSGFL